MRTLRTYVLVRCILFAVVAAMGWLGVGPSYGAAWQSLQENQRLAQWAAAHPAPSLLGQGLTDTPNSALRARINAVRAAIVAKRRAAGLPASPFPHDVRAWGARAMNDDQAANNDQASAANGDSTGPNALNDSATDSSTSASAAMPASAKVATLPAPSRVAAQPAPNGGADVRPLSALQMAHLSGRGTLRNPGFSGSLPWQRSFHDVNTSTGNLFKSYTDIQVAPARGAGLVLQRTYNSNDGSVGPFGVGWTHAYAIEMQESANVVSESGDPNADADPDDVPRTDFFGHKHTYHRDADGLYSPPPYLFDELSSDYKAELVTGPTRVEDDTDVGMDGTVKHYTSVLTLADGVTPGGDRACDSITDRYGNVTTLSYGQSFVQADGSTRKLLTQVTDPVGRSLVFTWTNLGTTSQPAYRITQVQGPLVSGQVVAGVTYTVTYAYYTNPSDPDAADDLYNLQSVTLDSGGLARTTSYTYTNCVSNYYDQNGNPVSDTENALLATVTDPLGHTTTYHYTFITPAVYYLTNGGPNPAGTVYVTQIDEPIANGAIQSWHLWMYYAPPGLYAGGAAGGPGTPGVMVVGCLISSIDDATTEIHPVDRVWVTSDAQLRTIGDNNGGIGATSGYTGYELEYDGANNVVDTECPMGFFNYSDGRSTNDYYQGTWWMQVTFAAYGAHGNVLTQWRPGYSGTDTTTYYNASQYFQKASETDYDGHTTSYGVGTDTAGNAGDPDPNIGDRGQVLWVQDPGYNDSSSPSYQKEYTYTYNQYGQKLTETNLNGVVTEYTYGTANDTTDGWYDAGNLTQVVQDPGGSGHLNRTTTMHYDAAGRVLQSTDPLGQVSAFTYNTLGQPLTVATPARGSAAAETISYAYDGSGRTTAVTDNRGTTTIAYESGDDRVASVTDPVTGTISYTYLPTGERNTVTLPGGGMWTYTYTFRTSSSSDASLLPKDDPNSVTLNPLCITDDEGRLLNTQLNTNGAPLMEEGDQVFDQNGNLVSYLVTQYQYEGSLVNSPSSLAGQVPVTVSVTRGTLAHVVQTYWWRVPNGYGGYGSWMGRPVSQSDYTYDNAGQRLTNTVTTMLPGAGGGPQYGGGTPTVDAYGNVTNEETNSRTETYTYDDLSRLSTVNYGDGQTQSYAFDAMGNRLSRQDSSAGTTNSTYNAANMLTATTGTGASTYISDADGDTLSGGGRTMAWDSQNRMVSCVNGSTTSAFTYGADGLRRSLTTGGTTTDYAYDGQNMAREMQVNPSTGSLVSTATYFAGPRGPEYRRDDTQTESDGQGHTFGKTRWYVYDGLGSVLGEVDPLGNLTCANEYDVYGNVRNRVGTATTEQGFVGSLGHLSDAGTGLIYMQARYMDPSTGRFTSEDPNGSGENWFTYCGNNPVNQCDPSGKNAVSAEDINYYQTGLLLSAGAVLESVFAFKCACLGPQAALCAAVASALALGACYDFLRALDGTSTAATACAVVGTAFLGGEALQVLNQLLLPSLSSASELGQAAGAAGIYCASAIFGAVAADTAALILVDEN